MVQFKASELATVLDGEVVGVDTLIDGVSIDSRAVEAGQLFVPLVAERDGHDFIESALQGGAAAYLASGEVSLSGQVSGQTKIMVADTAQALSTIGELARSKLTGHVIGVTGSVGKTSVKDLALAACSAGRRTSASQASFNNEIGVPLTLSNADEDIEILIVEMGARGKNHIEFLCGIAEPTIGVVTAVAMAHSELFGAIEDVALAKGELIDALPRHGIAVLNANDERVLAMSARTDASVLTYGVSTEAFQPDVAVEQLALGEDLRPSFRMSTEWGAASVTLEARGAHMAHNAAGAMAAAMAAGVPFDSAVSGLQTATLSDWRMTVSAMPSGGTVINDAYNANPTSMRAALSALCELSAQPRLAVLGVMAELGPEGPGEHLAIADEASKAGITVIAVDAEAYGPSAEHVSDIDQAFSVVQSVMGSEAANAAVLVKGSRMAGLERLAAMLLKRGE